MRLPILTGQLPSWLSPFNAPTSGWSGNGLGMGEDAPAQYRPGAVAEWQEAPLAAGGDAAWALSLTRAGVASLRWEGPDFPRKAMGLQA